MSVRSRAKHRIRRKQLGRPFLRLWAGFTLASSGDGLLPGRCPSWPSSSIRTPWPSPVWSPPTVCPGSSWRCRPARSPTGSHAAPSWPSRTSLRAARHPGRRIPHPERPDDAGDPDRGRADQRRRAGHVLLRAAGDRARARAVGCARTRQRRAQRHRGGRRAARRTGRRHLALRHEQGDPLLRRCRCDGVVLPPPRRLPLESAATRRGLDRRRGRVSGSSWPTAACGSCS